jgi:GTP-binding protein
MFADRARIHVEAGGGGNGVVSFRREAHVPRGGPDGGDGGHGGDVALVCDPSKRDLAALRHSPHVKAGRGEHGKGAQKHGARGEDREIAVPPGTQVTGLEGERYDLLEPGQRITVAHGGGGGHGNKRFASSTRQAPRFAESGLDGESGWIELRLKLLADAGFVGLPNAGKSSLLRRLTRAAPKVADYPFTTVDPVLGTLETDDRQLVLADIPGLIEGAAHGAGLGDEFLAHVERCRALLHVVDLAPPEGSPDPVAAHEIVRGELAEHGAGLEALPELVVLSKRDLLPADAVDEALREWGGRLSGSALGVIAVSSATGEGIDELRGAILAAVPEQQALKEGGPGRAAAGVPAGSPTRRAGDTPGFEAEHITYRPDAEQGFDVEPEDGAFRVHGRGIEVLVRRHDLSNPEALAYLEQRLREIGVLRELERAGFQPGDEVRIGEEAFELDP